MLPTILALLATDSSPFPFAFVTTQGEVAVAQTKDKTVKLTKGFQPDLSPDGKHVTFWANNSPQTNPQSESQLIITEITTKKQTLLAKGQFRTPKFSPDNKSIAYSKYSPQGWQLWVTNLSDPKKPNLVSSTDGFNPAWYPDSKTMLWPSLLQVTKLNLDKSVVWERLKASYLPENATPTWKDEYLPSPANPDLLLIYTFTPSDSPLAIQNQLPTLFINNPELPPTPITPPNLFITKAAWTAKGNSIIFSANSEKSKEESIYTINPDGTNLTKLFPGHSPSP